MEDKNKELENIKKEIEEECGEDYMNDLKSEAAWVLGLEPGSDEWDELLDI